MGTHDAVVGSNHVAPAHVPTADAADGSVEGLDSDDTTRLTSTTPPARMSATTPVITSTPTQLAPASSPSRWGKPALRADRRCVIVVSDR